MDTLFVAFEVSKVMNIGGRHGFNLIRRSGMSLPTFDVFDKYLDDYRVAIIQWTGESWACIDLSVPGSGTCACTIGAMLNEARSPYFWEI